MTTGNIKEGLLTYELQSTWNINHSLSHTHTNTPNPYFTPFCLNVLWLVYLHWIFYLCPTWVQNKGWLEGLFTYEVQSTWNINHSLSHTHTQTHQTLVLHLFALMSCGWFICTDLSPSFLMGIFLIYAQPGCKTWAD